MNLRVNASSDLDAAASETQRPLMGPGLTLGHTRMREETPRSPSAPSKPNFPPEHLEEKDIYDLTPVSAFWGKPDKKSKPHRKLRKRSNREKCVPKDRYTAYINSPEWEVLCHDCHMKRHRRYA